MLQNDYYNIEKGYEGIISSNPLFGQRPVIGVTANFSDGNCSLADGYVRSVLEAGGVPLLIPPYDNEENLIHTLDAVDGILLSGGGDINPLFMGEEPLEELHSINHRRDRQELLLVKLAADRQIPVLGICRGIQVMNVALGGKVFQDIRKQSGTECIKHDQELNRSYPSHTVRIPSDSLLYKLFEKTGTVCHDGLSLLVNSFHHQAVSVPAPGFRVCACSSDGIIEAIESEQYKSMIGVQWHPECMILEGNKSMMPLFEWLVKESLSFARARQMHQRIVSLDSHCDTPMFFDQNIRFNTRDSRIKVDIHKMYEGHLDGTIMVAYLKQEARDRDALQAATAKASSLLNQIEEMVAANSPYVGIAYTPQDVSRLKRENRKAIMLGIENAYAIGSDIANVERFRERGVVYMTLCHNGDNDVCDSARGNREHGGLSDFGRQVVREMNRVGMMVDLSHASEESFYDALRYSRTPIVCSHSSCRALCNHPRNLTDEQLRALAKAGGVAQVCIYGGFLREDGKAGLPDVVAHINHMVEVAGIDHVGIGTDFDGDGGVPGCDSAAEVINLTRRLMAEGYSEEDIAKIWGGNFMRLMEAVQADAMR